MIGAIMLFARAAAFAAVLAFAAPAAAQGIDELDPSLPTSREAVDVARWVAASGDNAGLPFAVLDKRMAQLFVFGADGRLRGIAPALIGSAPGDHAAPGVADRELSDIPMEDRTTPAGRFFAGYGPAAGRQSVLWVDHDSAVSLHAVKGPASERREERLASPTPDDNRISHGCINVSARFYNEVIRQTFGRAGYFYVLPEQGPITAALPDYRRVGRGRG